MMNEFNVFKTQELERSKSGSLRKMNSQEIAGIGVTSQGNPDDLIPGQMVDT